MGDAAWADGLTTISSSGAILDCFFPTVHLGRPDDGESPSGPAERKDELRDVVVRSVRVVIDDLDAAPADAADAYLRLHLLSHRAVQPNSISLEGLFGQLTNVAWTNLGPVDPSAVVEVATRARLDGIAFNVRSVDKFPRMLDYVVPSGVRIADGDRVRLGAHLAEGTTVMHEGFVNFNAGSLGTSMIEGRLSQGVVIDDGTDIGGGASTMGTLSGGGTERVRLGKRCLLGANSGLGIALGDDCTVEAGLYVTAGTVVTLPDGSTTKARDLSGQPGWLFRRHSVSGAVEAVRREGAWGELNTELHANQ